MGYLTLSICVTGNAASPHDSGRARALARLGHDVRMLSPSTAAIDGVPVTAIWGRALRPAPLRRLAMMASTLWALARSRADVVHCHYAAEYATWAAALMGKKPLVITVMGGDVLFDEQGTMGTVGRALTRMALRRADLVTVKSPRLAEVVARLGVEPRRVMMVLWGIDLEAFRADDGQVAALRDQWGATPDGPVLLSPRPLKPFYNQMLMVEAMPKVLARHPGALLVMSSFGEEDGFRAALDARAGELAIADRIRFVTGRPHEEMPSLYAAGDIVLSLPASDGFPQTLVEAAATGRPCVMVGAHRFMGLIAPDEHAVFTELDGASVAAAVLRLADDPAFSARIARGASAFAQAKANLPADARRVADHMVLLVKASRCAE